MKNRISPYKIFVIDDDSTSLEMARGLFGQGYEVACFTTCKSAKVFLNSLESEDLPNVILISISIKNENYKYKNFCNEVGTSTIEEAFEFIEYLKNHPIFSKIPFVFQSNNYDCEIQEKCFRLGASDFIFKPYNTIIANARISNVIKASLYRKQLELELEYQTQQTKEKKDKLLLNATQIVDALVSTIETNHMYTKGHSNRVAQFSVELAKKIKYPKNKLGFLKQAGLLHDIGKIGIANQILNKSHHLSDSEYFKIKNHTTLGYNILSSLEDFKIEKDVALHHHEKWDGTGYPCNLKGEEISLESRIVAIADAYDVMKYGRLYQQPKTNDEIADEFEKMAGIQFDPKLAKIFANMVRNKSLEKIIEKNNIQ